jgi:hypothetical protein
MKRSPLKRKTPLRNRRDKSKTRTKVLDRKVRIKSFGGGQRLPKRTMRKKRPVPTRAESAWMDRVCSLGCMICGKRANLHHVRTGYGVSQRASHFEVLPLCPDHHQYGGIGVAFHDGPRTWMAKFGTEIALLQSVYERLGHTFEDLIAWRVEPPPWWPQYLDGSALTSNAAIIFSTEDEDEDQSIPA